MYIDIKSATYYCVVLGHTEIHNELMSYFPLNPFADLVREVWGKDAASMSLLRKYIYISLPPQASHTSHIIYLFCIHRIHRIDRIPRQPHSPQYYGVCTYKRGLQYGVLYVSC